MALVAVAALMFCSALASASEPDLFSAPAAKAAPPKVYTSKQPELLPPEKPDALDLFARRPSPSVEALKAHADQRLLPGADRPLAIGMCCQGVIGSYDEAYRLALKTGKPLRVLVGQPWSHIVAQGKAEDGYLKCRVDDGTDNRFTAPGVYEYVPQGGRLVAFLGGRPSGANPIQASPPPVPPACPCGVQGCQCGCSTGQPCQCLGGVRLPGNQPIQPPAFYPPVQIVHPLPMPMQVGGPVCRD